MARHPRFAVVVEPTMSEYCAALLRSGMVTRFRRECKAVHPVEAVAATVVEAMPGYGQLLRQVGADKRAYAAKAAKLAGRRRRRRSRGGATVFSVKVPDAWAGALAECLRRRGSSLGEAMRCALVAVAGLPADGWGGFKPCPLLEKTLEALRDCAREVGGRGQGLGER